LKLSQLKNKIDAKLIGNSEKKIIGISSFNEPSSEKILYISNINILSKIDIHLYGALLVSNEIHNRLKNEKSINFLVSENHRLSFAKLSKIFKKSLTIPKKIVADSCSLSLYLGNNVRIGENFFHGSNVVIEDNSQIGDNVCLGHNVVIQSGTIISNNVIIESGTVIGSEGFGNVLSSDKEWEHIDHLGAVFIGKNVRIGSNCCIDRGTIDNTIISSGVIIDNLVHIAHNVFIGENTAIAAKVGIAGSCVIGKRNMIGGMVGIVDHIKTTNDVVISATSSVTKDLMEPGTYTGIMPISRHSSWKRIAFWITKLDKIVKKFNIKKI